MDQIREILGMVYGLLAQLGVLPYIMALMVIALVGAFIRTMFKRE